MTFPSYKAPHFCYYRRLQGSSNQLPNGDMEWIERCRCGRTIKAYMESVAGKPMQSKHWYDRSGNLERVTGYHHELEMSQSPTKTP